MKNRKFIGSLVGVILLVFILTNGIIHVIGKTLNTPQTETIAVAPIDTKINADGQIRSQNEATLHFQTGGKLTYLPFKEGAQVYTGQAIATLDTYALQKQLQAASDALASAKLSAEQTQEYNQAGILNGQQRTALDTTNKNSYNTSIQESQVIEDNLSRIVAQTNLSLDQASLNTQIAQYAIQLATLTAPFNGIITHEDVTVPNVNVTPATSFEIADPNALVFRANVLDSDIDFVSVGSPATITLDGNTKRSFTGTVVTVYPQKVTLSGGQTTYQVDIQSDDLQAYGKLNKSGSALITSNAATHAMLVPQWLVLGKHAIWVLADNKPVLREVGIGNTHGSSIEVVSGLESGDKIITNPKDITKLHYSIL